MKKHELEAVGSTVSTNVLVAMALAIAARETPDARGAMRDFITAAEEQIADSLNKLTETLPADQLEIVTGAARHNTLSIGRMADGLMKSMGLPPAQD